MTDIQYKPLETEFTKNTFRFRQLRREGDIAIFHKVAMQGTARPKAHDAGFETVVVSRHNGYDIAGVHMDPAECYPGNEQWGQKGWTYTTLFEAETRYEQLLGRAPEAPIIPDVEKDEETPGEEIETHRTRRPKGTALVLSVLPSGEFSVKELAAANKVEYVTAYQFVKQELDKTMKATRTERRAPKGPETQLYALKA